MTKLMSALIALSMLAGAATSASAQTRQDEREFDFWKRQQDRLP